MFSLTVATDELRGLKAAEPRQPSASLAGLKAAFDDGAPSYVAADYLSALVSSAIDDSEAERVAWALADSNASDENVRRFAELVLRGIGSVAGQFNADPRDSVEAARTQVALVRHSLQANPRNAVKRVDLALAHTILGNRVEARRQMNAAISLAPSNRFVLRSASRLAIHEDDFDRAHDVLIRSGAHLSDPWVLAATLSAGVLAELPGREVRLAREQLTGGHFAPRDLAELGGELATIELRSGKTKVARRLFEQALSDPNENTVAQAEWASEFGGFSIADQTLSIERGYEARARSHARLGEWADATREALAWQGDQPFALEPALQISYAAALGMEDYSTALSAAVVGIRSHPGEPMLHNNLAFSYANLGEVEKAREHLSQINFVEGDEASTFAATHGLVNFREGNTLVGRAEYARSIEGFQQASRNDRAAMAAALWAIEELRAGLPTALSTVENARRIGEHSNSPESVMLLARMEAKLSDRDFHAQTRLLGS